MAILEVKKMSDLERQRLLEFEAEYRAWDLILGSSKDSHLFVPEYARAYTDLVTYKHNLVQLYGMDNEEGEYINFDTVTGLITVEDF